jgi:nitrite reductase/ring-hydroxylating ferredoxin subunit
VKPKKETNLVQELRQLAAEESGSEAAAAAASGKASKGDPPGFPADWVDTKFKASEFEIGKTTKPLILASGKAIMLYRLGDKVFCSDANSTAYQYPLTDAKVSEDSKGVYVEVPLDGTVYNLQTGAVITWCPKDTPVRSVLGTLKGTAQPQPLPVYPVHIPKDGSIFIKLLQ